mgnify:CR=1 FL=1
MRLIAIAHNRISLSNRHCFIFVSFLFPVFNAAGDGFLVVIYQLSYFRGKHQLISNTISLQSEPELTPTPLHSTPLSATDPPPTPVMEEDVKNALQQLHRQGALRDLLNKAHRYEKGRRPGAVDLDLMSLLTDKGRFILENFPMTLHEGSHCTQYADMHIKLADLSTYKLMVASEVGELVNPSTPVSARKPPPPPPPALKTGKRKAREISTSSGTSENVSTYFV